MTFQEESVQHFFNGVNQRDLDKMGELLSPEAEFYFPKTQPLIGKDRILRFFSILFRQYPQLTFTILRTIHQEEHIAVHWTNQGINRKKEPYQNEGVTLLQWEGNKIRFISDFFKDTDKF
jgi:ketosteroid isomerase-like protein